MFALKDIWMLTWATVMSYLAKSNLWCLAKKKSIYRQSLKWWTVSQCAGRILFLAKWPFLCIIGMLCLCSYGYIRISRYLVPVAFTMRRNLLFVILFPFEPLLERYLSMTTRVRETCIGNYSELVSWSLFCPFFSFSAFFFFLVLQSFLEVFEHFVDLLILHKTWNIFPFFDSHLVSSTKGTQLVTSNSILNFLYCFVE